VAVTTHRFSSVRRYGALCLSVLIAGCGGGGGDDPAPPASSGWVSGSFLPMASFAAQCAAPRRGTDPQTGMPFRDTQGSATTENNWLRSWSNHLYLWYNEVVDRDPALYTTPAYFDLLKTSATTSSGSPKDKFHFTYPTAEFLALSQSGVQAGYGAEWAVLASVPPRRIVVAYTQPNSPATAPSANLRRGELVVAVDNVDVTLSDTQAEVDALNQGLYPQQPGETHSFTIRDPQTSVQRTVTMQSANVTTVPVQNVRTVNTLSGAVGYMLFTDHIATAEQLLVDAIGTLRAANVVDLVLDVRYNGGGYLDIASELAYMIAGTVPTAGQTFERLQFSDKHPAMNPVTGEALTPVPFHTQTLGFSAAPNQPLPTLNLSRVYVLTGGSTCSASESIINSLRGVNIQVIQIGGRTCGKPYGFYPADNCGTTYFSVQFKGVNAAGFGDYTDGFAPTNSTSALGTRIPGCAVGDDFDHALGDPAEARLASALAHRLGQSCPAPSGLNLSRPFELSEPGSPRSDGNDGIVHKTPWLENRSLERP
jgi:carboxyl-terminal processing protease